MNWTDKTGRLCATPPEHMVQSYYMRSDYGFTKSKKKPTMQESVDQRRLTRIENRETK